MPEALVEEGKYVTQRHVLCDIYVIYIYIYIYIYIKLYYIAIFRNADRKTDGWTCEWNDH